MTLLASALWELLTAAGGTLALSFIVAIALGINALTVLFLGSAVVVLERFARAARSPVSIVVACALIALAGGVFASALSDPEAAAEFEPGLPLPLWLASALGLVAAMLVLVPLVRVGLRRLPGSRLGALALAALGLGYALVVGGSDQLLYAAAPPALGAAAVGMLTWRRLRRGGAAGEAERMLWLLAPILALGIPLAALLGGPQPEVAAAGGIVFSVFTLLVLLGVLPLAAAGLFDMRRGAEWFIAARYLVAKRRQTFISVITLICVGGVAVGVWLIITVLSVMNGFERTWREEIIGNRAHFTVHSGLGSFEGYRELEQRVREMPDVEAVSPYVDAEGMVRGASGGIVGVRVRGVDPALVGQVTDLRHDIVAGSLDDLDPRPAGAAESEAPAQVGEVGAADADPGLVIGSELAAALGLQLGDPVLLVSPFGGPPTPLGPAPRLKRFRVAAIFKTSFFQWDEVFTYTSIPAAQDFRRAADVVDGLEVRVRDFYRSRRIAEAVQQELGFPYFTRDWKEYFPAFFQALKTERVMMFFLLTMIMVVAAFVIVATLIMMIMEKSSDIAILKAMGAEDASIERIFAIEGTLIGLVGTAVGVAAGIVVTTQLDWIQKQIEAITGIDTLPASVYQLSSLPWEIDVVQIVVVASIAMILSLGATLLPSRQGARLDPAEALRYE